MIERAPEMREAVNAVRLRADWRPLVGLTAEDAGTMIERVLARCVIGLAVEAHNADVKQSNAKAGR
jgi:hypothetical protein